MKSPEIVSDGDSCLTIVFEERIDATINSHCVAIARGLTEAPIAGVRDVVPAFHTVSVYFDPFQIDRQTLVNALEPLALAPHSIAHKDERPFEIAVEYGGAAGPDLADVARFAGCDESEAVRLHAAVVYRVFMLGFLPGFAYLGSVDPRIAMPRLDTPRAHVAAGSVGIAGGQTAIYPVDSPGGWRIIGRTSVRVYDPDRGDPSLLKPGQRVKFVAG